VPVPSIIVAAPQLEEADALLGGFVRSGLVVEELQVGRLQCAYIPVLDLLVAVAGNGKTQFAVQSQHLIDHCPDARLLVCAGGAGRLVDALEPGDVVVATTTIETITRNDSSRSRCRRTMPTREPWVKCARPPPRARSRFV
jgi:adenosylhomocysteine nucleosidase